MLLKQMQLAPARSLFGPAGLAAILAASGAPRSSVHAHLRAAPMMTWYIHPAPGSPPLARVAAGEGALDVLAQARPPLSESAAPSPPQRTAPDPCSPTQPISS